MSTKISFFWVMSVVCSLLATPLPDAQRTKVNSATFFSQVDPRQRRIQRENVALAPHLPSKPTLGASNSRTSRIIWHSPSLSNSHSDRGSDNKEFSSIPEEIQSIPVNITGILEMELKKIPMDNEHLQEDIKSNDLSCCKEDLINIIDEHKTGSENEARDNLTSSNKVASMQDMDLLSYDYDYINYIYDLDFTNYDAISMQANAEVTETPVSVIQTTSETSTVDDTYTTEIPPLEDILTTAEPSERSTTLTSENIEAIQKEPPSVANELPITPKSETIMSLDINKTEIPTKIKEIDFSKVTTELLMSQLDISKVTTGIPIIISKSKSSDIELPIKQLLKTDFPPVNITTQSPPSQRPSLNLKRRKIHRNHRLKIKNSTKYRKIKVRKLLNISATPFRYTTSRTFIENKKEQSQNRSAKHQLPLKEMSEELSQNTTLNKSAKKNNQDLTFIENKHEQPQKKISKPQLPLKGLSEELSRNTTLNKSKNNQDFSQNKLISRLKESSHNTTRNNSLQNDGWSIESSVAVEIRVETPQHRQAKSFSSNPKKNLVISRKNGTRQKANKPILTPFIRKDNMRLKDVLFLEVSATPRTVDLNNKKAPPIYTLKTTLPSPLNKDIKKISYNSNDSTANSNLTMIDEDKKTLNVDFISNVTNEVAKLETGSSTVSPVPAKSKDNVQNSSNLSKSLNANNATSTRNISPKFLKRQLGLNPLGLNPGGLAPFGLSPEGYFPFGIAPTGLTATTIPSNKTNASAINSNTVENISVITDSTFQNNSTDSSSETVNSTVIVKHVTEKLSPDVATKPSPVVETKPLPDVASTASPEVTSSSEKSTTTMVEIVTSLTKSPREERYHVQVKRPDGSINGDYIVQDHNTGSINGVRYEAIDGADQALIQRALLQFLSLDPRLDPRPKQRQR